MTSISSITTGRLARTRAVSSGLMPRGKPGNISRRRRCRAISLSQAAAVTLASAEDLAIDELSGIAYWVSGGEVWRATMPVGSP